MSLNIKWSEFIPEDKKPHAKQLAFLSLPHLEALYGGAASGGKALGLNTQVLTPYGYRPLDLLKVGDKVSTPDGSHANIIGVYEQGKRPTYKITFQDGSTCIADEEHLWAYSISGKHKWRKSKKKLKIATTKQLLNLMNSGLSILTPVTKPVQFTKSYRYNPCKIDPWFLGALLGDGGITNNTGTISYCSNDPELIEKVKALKYEWRQKDRNETFSHLYTRDEELKETLEKLGLLGKHSWEKFIPKCYKFLSVEGRWELLRGLMDTDGYISVEGKTYYTTTSKQLAEDVRWLCSSLGCRVTITNKIPTYEHKNEKLKGRKAYTLYIRIKDSSKCFSLRRKKERGRILNTEIKRRIVSIVPNGKELCKCIKIDTLDGLFLINDFIVTHNSEALLFGALAWCDTPGFRGLIIRRTFTDMLLPSSILSRCKEWLNPWLAAKIVKYDKSQHTFYFPSGAQLAFGYLKASGSQERYQSSEYHYIAFDELTHFLEKEYRYLFSRLRRNVGTDHIPLKVRAGTNPGGQGHLWVKNRFGIKRHEDTEEWYGSKPDMPFVQATVKDNPYVGKEYIDSLMKLPKLERERLMNGDWDAIEDAIFDMHWFMNRYTVKTNGQNCWYHLMTMDGLEWYADHDLMYFTTVDCAASQKTGIKNVSFIDDRQPSHSVISTWAVTPKYDLLLLDVERFQSTIPTLVDKLCRNQKIWNPLYNIIEKNGPGEGVYQIAVQRGLPVKPIHSSSDKVINSTAAQLRAEQGKIWLPAFKPWLKNFEDEIFSWSGQKSQPDDQVDTLSNAANEVMELSVGYERDLLYRSGLKRAVPTASLGGIQTGKNAIGGKERMKQSIFRINAGIGRRSTGLEYLR